MSETFKTEDILALPGRVLIHCDKSQEVKIQLESALRIQQSVKEEIDITKYRIKHFIPEWEVSTYTIPILESNLRLLYHVQEELEK